jgi:hypothetical protein
MHNALSDPAIPKVGVGANKDAQHLARWCGIKDRDYIGYFFWGIRDTEEEGDECVQDKTLLTMCEQVFQHSASVIVVKAYVFPSLLAVPSNKQVDGNWVFRFAFFIFALQFLDSTASIWANRDHQDCPS